MAHKKRPAKPTAGPSPPSTAAHIQWLDLLIPKDIQELIAGYQQGTITQDEPVTGPEITDKLAPILPFIQAHGDFEVLGQLLKTHPDLLFHPVVLVLVQYLRGYATGPYVPHPAEQEYIDWALKCIVEGWVEGVLPGSTVKPPKKSAGRKIDWIEQDRRRQLIKEYHSLLYHFGKHVVSKNLIAVPNQILNAYWEWKGPEAKTAVSFFVQPPPSLQSIKEWTKDPKYSTDGFNDFLAYRFLAHQYSVKPDQIRGWIARQRNEDLPIKIFTGYQVAFPSFKEVLQKAKIQQTSISKIQSPHQYKRLQGLLHKVYGHLQECFFPGGITFYPECETYRHPALKDSHIQEWLRTLPRNHGIEDSQKYLIFQLLGHYFGRSADEIHQIVKTCLPPKGTPTSTPR
ncbi:MAG: hypothetical protein O7F12_14570 [Nitrospirae bacterium]|nr:hypothetical protein [Nitrospirota bacterium]